MVIYSIYDLYGYTLQKSLAASVPQSTVFSLGYLQYTIYMISMDIEYYNLCSAEYRGDNLRRSNAIPRGVGGTD
jgi:hypothetical protein